MTGLRLFGITAGTPVLAKSTAVLNRQAQAWSTKKKRKKLAFMPVQFDKLQAVGVVHPFRDRGSPGKMRIGNATELIVDKVVQEKVSNITDRDTIFLQGHVRISG